MKKKNWNSPEGGILKVTYDANFQVNNFNFGYC